MLFRSKTREEAVEKIGSFRLAEGHAKTVPELRKRGVRICIGGDYGFPFNPQGWNARDIEILVKTHGYTPAEALGAATMNGGILMGMGDELGLIRNGYLADFLIVDGDPLADVAILQDKERLAAIVKDGMATTGLAVGSLLAGRTADRVRHPLRWFAGGAGDARGRPGLWRPGTGRG